MKETLLTKLQREALRLYDEYYKHGTQEDGSTTYVTEKDFDIMSKEIIAHTLKQAAEALEVLKKNCELCGGNYHYECPKAQYDEALTEAQKVLLEELDK
jgi:hypothetical protein